MAENETKIPPEFDDEELILQDDDPAESSGASIPPWKILIVDDEQDVHKVTSLALDDVTFQDRPLKILNAFNGNDARELITDNPDTALILLDVVMESNQAGLEFVKFVREELKNSFVRIIMRTGQPGQAPPKKVIVNYEINDYKTKTELTSEKLFASVIAGLRSYDALTTVDSYRRGLEQKVEERTREISLQKDELVKLNSMKDKFFSIIAHDLKNPFTALLGYSEMLLEDYEELPDTEKKEYIGEIQETAKQTFDLLQNLLHWSRSQQNTFKMNPEKFDLFKLAEKTSALVRMTAITKNITFTQQVPENTIVYADIEMVLTVLRNLVSNALKFTEAGGAVTLSAVPDGDMLMVRVSDTGVGIKPEDQELLFRMDVSHSTVGTNNESGTGLGLILCKEFVEKSGGAITVDSESGKGATFSFTIPTSG